MAELIRVENVTKRFGDVVALDRINISFESGKIYGITGRNGSGKTVLFKTMIGYLKPTGGRVVVGGKEIGKDIDFPDNMGIIIENPGFLSRYTGYKNLEYLASIRRRIGRAQIRESMERVGLDPDSRKKAGKYSLGMRQRLGIAQALLNDPEVLILDEPTGGLDPGERVRFRNLLSEFAHDRIVLISTHIVPDVEYIAGCHAMIREGKLLATGTTEELVRLVEGKVWTCTVPAQAVAEYERRLRIVSLRNEHDGSGSVRYLAKKPCNDHSAAAVPRLEDLYLWMFPQSGGADRKKSSRKQAVSENL